MTDDGDRYGRVTNAERYRVLHDAADGIVAALAERPDITVERGGPDLDPDLAGRAAGCERVTRITRDGASATTITIAWTAFPGVLVRSRADSPDVEAFPRCGCDACDEPPDALADELRATIADLLPPAPPGRATV